MKRLLVTLAITLVIVPVLSCTPPELPYLMPVAEFSFTGIWDEMLETTGAGRTDIHLQSFNLKTRHDKIVYCYAHFSSRDNDGILMGYAVGTDSECKLQWSSGDVRGETPEMPDYNPANTFAELDRLGIEAIIDGAKSVGIQIEYIYNERQYAYADMFRLYDGELLPLREVSFPKDAGAAQIQVTRFYEREEGAPFALGRFRNMSEWWFTENDLEKAESVVFAKNRQGPAFVNFLKSVYEALPEGWKMSLGTREGHMSPPRGLEEPRFILVFEDTVNSFSIPADPTKSSISPNLRLYFYDIDEKESIMEIIEQQKKYSWDIPQYYDESSLYIAITSPVYINSGWYEDEAMQYYKPLAEALRLYFEKQRE